MLRDLIYKRDPYEGLSIGTHRLDASGWGSDHYIFEHLFRELNPRIVIEVGTWKGGSALHMARLLAQQTGGRNFEILCVDTWLGALEMWERQDDETRYGALDLVNGFPSIYYKFAKNVVMSGFNDVITPFPVPSALAAAFLARRNVKADVVYIDGSHEYDDVLRDLKGFWPIAGKAMFGDDYAIPNVKRAVDEFAGQIGVPARITEVKWVLLRHEIPPSPSFSALFDRRGGEGE